MHSDEENRPLVASPPQARSRGRMYILIIVGILILGALVGAAITFSVWQHSEPASGNASVGSNQTFSSRMTIEEIMTTLQTLQDIAYANNGTRAVGTDGYNVTGQYVMDTLNSYGYFKVERQDFPYDVRYRQLAKPTLAIVNPNPYNFTYDIDFEEVYFSGSGDVIANISVVQNVGCDAVDWAGFPAGNIALVLRGVCDYDQKTLHAMAANVSALLVYSNRTGLPSAETLSNVTFPVFTLSNQTGKMLKDLHETQPVTLHVTGNNVIIKNMTFNILAEPLSGPASGPVVVVGAHLDSVPAGPGINDNGSGTATLLALARIVAETKMFKQDSPAQLRLAWWGSEERSLLGSKYYVKDLKRNHPDQFARIALNLNFDMLGSPNFIRGIRDGSTAPEDLRNGSTLTQKLFEGYFQSQDLAFTLVALDGRSDYAPFIANGIPAGGLFTGAEGKKTLEERKLFGGVAYASYDPCYHKACDTVDNINTQVLDEMSKSVAEVTATVLFNPSILAGINPKFAKNN